MADASARTTRLELADATLREWSAVVLDASPDGVVLDRSAFYPGGGGQPPDQGVLLWSGGQSRVVGVRRGDDLLLQLAEGDPVPPVGTSVRWSPAATWSRCWPGWTSICPTYRPTSRAGSPRRAPERWPPTGASTSACCRGRLPSRSRTSSERRPTCCRPI